MEHPLRDRPWLTCGVYAIAGCIAGRLLFSAGAGAFALWGSLALFGALALIGLFFRRPGGRIFLRLSALLLAAAWMALHLIGFSAQSEIEGFVRGRVAEYPTSASGSQVRLVLDDVSAYTENGWEPVAGKVRVYLPAGEYLYGDTVTLKAELYRPSAKRNLGSSDSRDSLYARGVTLSGNGELPVRVERPQFSLQRGILSARAYVEEGIRENCGAESAAMVIGMLFGDTSGMTFAELETFRDTGTAHVLSVSGLHVSILAQLVALGLGKILKGKRVPVLLMTAAFLYCYTVMSSYSVSVIRAALMLLFHLFDDARGEQRDGLESMGFAAAVQVVLNPCAVFGISFILSYGAVLGIFCIGTPMAQKLERLKEPHPRLYALWSTISVSTGAQLGALPATLWYFGLLPVLSLVWNILLVPVAELILPLALFGCLLGAAAPLAFLAGSLASVMMAVARFGASLPFAAITTGSISLPALLALLIILLGLTCWVRSRGLRAVLLTAGGALAAASLLLAEVQKEDLRVTMLDVGQSEAIVLEHGGRAMLIDAGMKSEYTDRGAYVVLPYLRYRGIPVLDCVVVTHNDSDHIGGMATVAENMEIGAAYLSTTQESAPLAAFLKAAGDTPVFTLQSGDEIRFGGVRLRVLWPREETGGNEGSLVLLLEYDGRRMLFTGDIGEEEEEQLLAGLCDVDVLKVAHHGSKYSTTQAFLEAVRPEVALISAGRGNSYGFPAPETLERLKEAGAETYVTAESGAISVVVRQGELFVETMLRETEE